MKSIIILNDDDDMTIGGTLLEDQKCNNGMFFTDGDRRIDFVLVYQQLQDNEIKHAKRKSFIKSLTEEGLEIEIQDESGNSGYQIDSTSYRTGESSGTVQLDNLVFIKIHASWETLCRYAEIMKIQKPIMNAGVDYNFNFESIFEKLAKKGLHCFKMFDIDRSSLKSIPQGYTYPFSKQKDYLFDIPVDKSNYFTPGERSLIVNYILKRQSYKSSNDTTNLEYPNDKNHRKDDVRMNTITKKDSEIKTEYVDQNFNQESDDDATNLNVGIAKLISEGVFESAYILHEPKKKPSTGKSCEYTKENLRYVLYKNWASMENLFRIQPLHHIRLYFGEMVAFYFAWLGYYTFWLFPIAIFGVFVTIYNFIYTSSDIIINEIYNSTNITMCPVLCIPKKCETWKLSDGYVQFYLIRLVDNAPTVILAGVTSVWAFLFLEMWKRKQFRLAFRWNVHDLEVEDEPLRPEFAALLEKNYPRKFNQISGREEPLISFWRKKIPIIFLTYSTVIFSIVMALAVLAGITISKTVIRNMLRIRTTYVMSKLSTAAIGSLISLITIMILTSVYSKVAVGLTNLEHHRTQAQYDSSVTLKLYLLEFINNYSSMFYIGFVHPFTQVIPGSNLIFMIKPQGCLTGDCLLDLSMQLIFILVGKQIINNIIDYSIPRLRSLIKAYTLKKAKNKLNDKRKSYRSNLGDEDLNNNADPNIIEKSFVIKKSYGMSKMIHKVQPELIRCYADNILEDPEPRSLFKEYLQMVIQFGFITIFILPFPLAPLLALINNLFEVRSDALKFVTIYRRPVAQRAKDIGIWIDILTIVCKIVVKSNALLIAFATSYIERLIYAIWHNDFKLNGFTNFTLSYMNYSEVVKHYNIALNTNETICGYIGFRYPSWDANNKFSYTPVYWQMLAAKIAFVYLFETFVALFVKMISVVIPDVPDKYRIAMKREATITNEFILRIELDKQKNQYEPKNLAKSFKKSIVNYRNKISKFSSAKQILLMTGDESKV